LEFFFCFFLDLDLLAASVTELLDELVADDDVDEEDEAEDVDDDDDDDDDDREETDVSLFFSSI
jgi:hypothetical protein